MNEICCPYYVVGVSENPVGGGVGGDGGGGGGGGGGVR